MLNNTKVLAIDPSFTATGWALVKNDKILAKGVFKLDKEKTKLVTSSNVIRQQDYFAFITGLLMEHRPNLVVCEYPHGAQDAKAAWSFAVTTTAIISACLAKQVPYKFCLESQSKKCVLGHSKHTSKEEMRGRILDIYGKNGYIEDKAKYKAEAVADALAVYTYFKLNEKGI